MIILHTSDWHLGRTLHGADLGEAADAFLDWLCHVVDERRVDAVLISGDIFDRAVPPISAIHRFSRVISRLSSQTKVIITSGNHDGPIRLGMTASILNPSVVLATDPLSVGTAIPVQPVSSPSPEDSDINEGDAGDTGVGVLVYPIPYLEPDLVRYQLAEMNSSETYLGADGEEYRDDSFVADDQPRPLARSHEAVVAAALRRIGDDLRRHRSRGDHRPAIAMVHAFISGALPSDSERDITVGGVPSVPAHIFASLGESSTDASSSESPSDRDRAVELDLAPINASSSSCGTDAGEDPLDSSPTGRERCAVGLTYVAAGHLHRPQLVTSSPVPIRYSGSPIAYSFSEAGADKSVTLVHIEGDGTCEWEALPIPVHRPIRVICGTFNDLIAGAPHDAADAYYSITVTDPYRPERLVPRIREIYPHALVIHHDPEKTPEHDPRVLAQIPHRRPADVTRDFFAAVGGRQLTHEERSVIDDVWTQMRTEHSA
ncbi:exonuclease SbcCD subunit D [Schaalia sp. ZJ1691]|uniref:exonuclease SbcCD subunit D n=1 Tax=Schaalia sp. ZJ1691 TaxID=2709404 RepID=UPI0013E9EC1A|nr:exonuclease SbcCD subunit D [Schaalia sp. ZJ1691]